MSANCFGEHFPGWLANAREAERILRVWQLPPCPTYYLHLRTEATLMQRSRAKKNRCRLLGQRCLSRPEWRECIAERTRRRALRKRDPRSQVATATYRARF